MEKMGGEVKDCLSKSLYSSKRERDRNKSGSEIYFIQCSPYLTYIGLQKSREFSTKVKVSLEHTEPLECALTIFILLLRYLLG